MLLNSKSFEEDNKTVGIEWNRDMKIINKSKYDKLQSYFTHSNEDVLSLSFSEIETILGFKLNESAYKHSAIWSNSNSHPIALAWLNAGYKSEQLSLARQTIVFRKSGYLSSQLRVAKKKREKKEISTMTADIAIQLIKDYLNETVKDEHGRYLSWKHCYQAFSERRNVVDKQTIDYLALHLAFYLASWGMYRGSSFLLQKDYKVHIPVVLIIQEHKYDSLFGISAQALCAQSNLVLLEDIGKRIKECYAQEVPACKSGINNATDTLITKILLGTFGCVPAYDRYYVYAVKKNNISSGIYNKNSVRSVAEFYCNNLDAFEELRRELNKGQIEYPPMKLMDMCFWQDAYIDDIEQR